jgi:hypothetical protein
VGCSQVPRTEGSAGSEGRCSCLAGECSGGAGHWQMKALFISPSAEVRDTGWVEKEGGGEGHEENARWGSTFHASLMWFSPMLAATTPSPFTPTHGCRGVITDAYHCSNVITQSILALCRGLRREPVVAMTARSDELSVDRGLDRGAAARRSDWAPTDNGTYREHCTAWDSTRKKGRQCERSEISLLLTMM